MLQDIPPDWSEPGVSNRATYYHEDISLVSAVEVDKHIDHAI
jgi:hypothetical protein